MAEPRSKEEYEARYCTNTYISGFGLSVKQHFACPFCGAKDWAEAFILDLAASLSVPKKCSDCDRSAVIEFSGGPGAMSFTVYQTAGKDPPEWIPIPRKPTLPETPASPGSGPTSR